MAALVTLAAVPLAYPLAYYMARYASPRMKMLLYVVILLPLWSSYLVRVYAWKLILAKEGIISWFAERTGTRAGCWMRCWRIRRGRAHRWRFSTSASSSRLCTCGCRT